MEKDLYEDYPGQYLAGPQDMVHPDDFVNMNKSNVDIESNIVMDTWWNRMVYWYIVPLLRKIKIMK